MPSRLVMLLGVLCTALVLACAAALREAHWRGVEVARYKEVAEERTRQLEAAQARLARTQSALRLAERQRQERERSMQELLNAEAEWSRGAVPEPVADGLCGIVRCN